MEDVKDGDVVRITEVSKGDAFYEDREDIVGKEFTVRGNNSVKPTDNGFYSLGTMTFGMRIFYAVKFEKVKSEGVPS